MRKLIVSIFGCVAVVLLLGMGGGQNLVVGGMHRTVPGSAPTLSVVGYSYCQLAASVSTVSTNSSGCIYGAGGAIIAASGNIAIVQCSATSSGITYSNGSDSNSDTFTQLTHQIFATTWIEQLSYSFLTHSGSTNFTCTNSKAATYSAIVVVVYKDSAGFPGTTQTAVYENANSTTLSFPVATTQRSLNIICAAADYGATWSSGAMPTGTAAALIASNGASLNPAENPWCEGMVSGSAISGTATFVTTGSGYNAGTYLGVNY